MKFKPLLIVILLLTWSALAQALTVRFDQISDSEVAWGKRSARLTCIGQRTVGRCFGAPLRRGGSKSLYQYDANGNVTREEMRNGSKVWVTSKRYDNENRLIEEQSENGTRTWMFDAKGQLLQESDERNLSTRYTYNARGEKVEEFAPSGQRQEWFYDQMGNEIIHTSLPVTSYTRYDELYRVKETEVDGAISKSEYNAAGEMTASVDPTGIRTEYTYDLAGKRLTSKDALGNITKEHYDAAGRRDWSEDALNRRMSFEYDLLGRLLKTTYADGSFTRAVYDDAGRVTQRLDELNRQTQFFYDAESRLTKVRDADGKETSYIYDSLGNRIAQIDALGRETKFEFDNQNRMTRRTLPMLQFEAMSYDRQGRVTNQQTLAKQSIASRYNVQQLPAHRALSTGQEYALEYQRNGWLARHDNRGVVLVQTASSRNYNNRGQLVNESTQGASTIFNSVDAAGRTLDSRLQGLTRQTQPTKHRYDAVGRLSTVTDDLGGVTTITYDAVYRPVSTTYPDGAIETRSYDLRDRILVIERKLANVLVSKTEYTYDIAGQRLTDTQTEVNASGATVRAQVHTYDVLSRLTSTAITETVNGVAQSEAWAWTFDAVGNRLTETVTRGASVPVIRTYTYDDNDRILTEQTNEASPERVLRNYDDGGRLVRKLVKRGLEPAAAVVSDAVYRWDAEDRLVRVEVAGRPAIDHKYDAMGNLIASVEEGASANIDQRTRAYTLDSRFGFPQVVQEVGTSSEKFRYTVASGIVPSGGWRMGQVRVSGTTETVSRFAVDAQGSIRSVFDSAGVTSDTLGYLPYGEVSDRTDSTLLPFGYTGEFFEPVSGLLYLRARWLEPESGRFLSMDPFEGFSYLPATLNKYSYLENSPNVRVDPSGLTGYIVGQLIGIHIAADTNTVLKAANATAARKAFKTLMFGKPPEDFGIIGEFVIDAAWNSVFSIVGLEFHDKQAAGTTAHKKMELEIRANLENYPLPAGYQLVPEVFFDPNGEEGTTRAQGTLGIDVLIKKNGKNIIGLDLKLGAGFSKKKREAIRSRANAKNDDGSEFTIYEIFIGVKPKTP